MEHRLRSKSTAYCLLLTVNCLLPFSTWEVLRLGKMGRRYKVYPAETGISYQYFFDSRRHVARPENQGAGSDFTFVVIADPQPRQQPCRGFFVFSPGLPRQRRY